MPVQTPLPRVSGDLLLGRPLPTRAPPRAPLAAGAAAATDSSGGAIIDFRLASRTALLTKVKPLGVQTGTLLMTSTYMREPRPTYHRSLGIFKRQFPHPAEEQLLRGLGISDAAAPFSNNIAP